MDHASTADVVAASPAFSTHPTSSRLYKRKHNAEDPANPVAAAATDPNEAAMKIKSRDLINTDRQDFHPDPHPHRHHGQAHHDSNDDDDTDNIRDQDDDDEGEAKPANKKGSSKKKAAKDSDSDDGAKDDSDDLDSKSKNKKSKTKQKSSKDGEKKDAKGKDDKKTKGKGDKKGKKTHTGLDGKEVDDEDEEGEEVHKKKVHLKHVKAKQRRWRTGKPKYNYKKALDGWKEVGPLYYYKGKYENGASSTRHSFATAAGVAALIAAAAGVSYF
ncbi:hypothetical protein LPJ53_003252 [Coemansia erecta]|uniref:Uncharacterized protein n=1 Tax=Coemansia erecta TaxID=147472 RepID=A0A9W7Y0H0_9FUNG|nr:hypothetical protein LPJ53_003252 [Coemansia erecta]